MILPFITVAYWYKTKCMYFVGEISNHSEQKNWCLRIHNFYFVSLMFMLNLPYGVHYISRIYITKYYYFVASGPFLVNVYVWPSLNNNFLCILYLLVTFRLAYHETRSGYKKNKHLNKYSTWLASPDKLFVTFNRKSWRI